METATDANTEEPLATEAEWAWTIAICVTFFSVVMFDREGLMYALGTVCAGITFGFLIAGVWWLVTRLFTKRPWRWFKWFNVAAFTALVVQIGHLTLPPLARYMVSIS